jgi:hypothetical protein
MIHHQPFDELGVRIRFVLHLHHFDHVQVDRVAPCVDTGGAGLSGYWLDCEDSINDIGGKLFGEDGVEFRREGGMCDGDEVGTVEVGGLLEAVEELPAVSIHRLSGTSRRTERASFFAMSNPSPMTRGCTPSWIYRSACFNSSPTSSTTEVVPSPTCSS